MEKVKLIEEMKAKGLLSQIRKEDPLWQKAFSLYKTETGDKQVSEKCGMCWTKVLQWLKK